MAHARARSWPFAWLAALVALALSLVAPAARAFVPPPNAGFVTDTAHVLSPRDVAYLDAKLEAEQRATGNDIAVLVVGSLGGESIDDVAYDTFNAWKLGQKGADNGVLLVIAPAERKIRIETGKGTGGALTDLQSNDIIRRTIGPLLREGRYRDAIDAGTTEIADALRRGGVHGRRGAPGAGGADVALSLVLAGVLLVVMILASIARRGGGGGGGRWRGGGGGGGIFVPPIILPPPDDRDRGGWGGGGWGGGGGGGGGFPGGGGESGGGGSSDSY